MTGALYKVKVLYLNVNNKVYRSGELVSAKIIPPTHLKKLLEENRIELFDGETPSTETPVDPLAPVLFIIERNGADHSVRSVDDIDGLEIITILNDYNIQYDTDGSKESDWAALKKSLEAGYPELVDLRLPVIEPRDVLFFVERDGVSVGIANMDEVSVQELSDYLKSAQIDVDANAPKEILWAAAVTAKVATTTAENDTQAGNLLAGIGLGDLTEVKQADKPVVITIQRDGKAHEVREIEDISKTEIKKVLDGMKEAKNLEYSAQKSKEFLWDLMIKSL